jgi:hypothetical protein
MNLSQDDVVAILKKLKGEQVYFRIRFTTDDDPTWSRDGEFYLRFDGASFRLPDQNDTALVGLHISRPEGIRCVVCASGPLDRIVNQLFNRAIGKPRIGEQN